MSDPPLPPPPNAAPPPPPPPSVAPPPPPPPYGGAPGTGYPPGYGAAPRPPYDAGFGEGSPEYAGFWARFGATLLDGLIFLVMLIPFGVAAAILIARALEDCYWTDADGREGDELRCPAGAVDGAPLALGIVIGAVGVVLVAFVFVWMLAKRGQTWGRKAAGIKVVRADDGSPPGWGKAIGRTLFASFISANICYLGYLWMLWDSKNQTWHDKVAGTVVVKS